MDGFGGLIALILILLILWPILKFVFKLTFWMIVDILFAVAIAWGLLVMGGCAVLLTLL